MNCPKVLIFAPLCYPPAGAEAIVTSKLVLAMIEAGWQVKVISQADFGQFYPVDDNENWRPLLSVVENIEGIDEKSIIRRLVGVKLTNKLRTLFWVIKAVRSGFVALRKAKYDFILSRAAPQYGHFPALILKGFAKIPWISNWSDPFPPQKAPPPYGKGINARISIFIHLYNYMVSRFADWHIYPSERLMKYYWKMAPEVKEKSSVIPHIALRNFCIKETSAENAFTVCHTGSVGNRDLSVFFDGLKRFINEAKPSHKFRVIFIGDPIDEIQCKVAHAGITDLVRVDAPRSYEETQTIAASSSVLLVIEAHCEEGIFFPSKFIDFVQTGKPILAVSPIPGTLHDILSNYGGGIAVDNRSSDKVFSALKELYSAWEKGTLLKRYGSAKLFDHFSAEYVLPEYSHIFDKLHKKGKNRS